MGWHHSRILALLTTLCACSSTPDPTTDAADSFDGGTDAAVPGPEPLCDGADDDGDGVIDEGFDLDNDPANCGSCSNLCELPNATGTCGGGECSAQISLCDDGFADCDGDASNGCEAELGTIEACAGCGDDCTGIAHAARACESGVCVQTGLCDGGYDDCDGDPSNGCETSLSTASDCGSCGTICDPAAAGGSCAGGVCTVASCDVGYADCNADASDGCEQALNELLNCGFCRSECAPADALAPTCDSRSCTIGACVDGFADCNAQVSDGCEVRTDTITDCGACGTECSWPNATGSCDGTSCVFGACNRGWADCTAEPGCETRLGTDTACSGCGDACTFDNGSGTCGAGLACRLTSCDPAWADCTIANGCETPLGTTADCAACGDSCSLPNATASCVASECVVIPGDCDTGWDDCLVDPGCETRLGTIQNCSFCGHRCSLDFAVATCSASGTCEVLRCEANHFNCNGMHGDGCETPCAFAHGVGVCAGTSCAFGSCDTGWASCDGDLSDGCETSLNADPNCGGCGINCAAAGRDCCRGSCVSPGTCPDL